MRRTLILGLFLALVCAVPASAQTGPGVTPVEPFKVGTFDIHDVPHVGLVLRDSLVIDIEAANMALASNPDYPTVPMPKDMLELIGRYEYGLRYRLYEIVNDAVNNNRLTGSGRASFVYDVAELRTRPPIMYPGKIMNAAVNFYTHACEGCTEEELQARTRERQENRGVPYLFLKPSRGAVIGSGDDVVMPYQPVVKVPRSRDRHDRSCVLHCRAWRWGQAAVERGKRRCGCPRRICRRVLGTRFTSG